MTNHYHIVVETVEGNLSQGMRQLNNDDLRRDAYHGLFEGHMDEAVLDDISLSTNGNYVFGNERFKDEISGILKRRVCLVKQTDRRSLINRGLSPPLISLPGNYTF